MLLIYYRTYITHAFLAFLFSIGDATVSRNIRRLEPLLAGIFRIPERRAEVREDEVRELFFDGTERPTRRPQRRQRRSYSGKEERHTLKNQVVVVRKRKRAGGRPGGGRSAGSGWRRCRRWRRGRCTTRRCYDRARVLDQPGVLATWDTGYQRTALLTPVKRKRGQRPTRRQQRQRADQPVADRGGARDREYEDLAGRLGMVPEPGPPAHADRQERGRSA